MQLLSELQKIDIGLVPQALNNNNLTSRYYDMSGSRTFLAIAQVGAMAAATTATLSLFEATNAAGGGAQAIAAASAVATANTNVTVATLTLNAVQVADAVTINGLIYTAAAAPVLASRIFDQSGNDDADAVSLAAAINHATAGVPGVTAVAAGGGLVTLTATDPGATVITITAPAATITPATLQAVLFVEFRADMMTAGFTHLAARLATTANTIVAMQILRDSLRYGVQQQVAASDVEVHG